ncbi:MAG: choice-of-anchor Q domain-containing protein [Dokdonella sp.]
MDILESTIAGNFAPDGGGGGVGIINSSYERTDINHSTITGNVTLTGSDNGIYSSAGANNTFRYDIIANNFSAANDDDLIGDFKIYLSLVKTPGVAVIAGTGNMFGADPELSLLADNGGPTLTMLPAVTSPVIDRIPGGGFSTDQRWLPRAVPELADMGAVERQYPEVVIFDNSFDGS